MARALDNEIVAEHLSEAIFLHRIRDAAVVAPQHDAETIAALDERIDANLDGVRIAGDDGLGAAQAELDADEPGSVFVLTTLGLESGSTAAIDAALECASESPSAARGAVAALAFAGFDRAEKVIGRLLHDADDPTRRRIGLAACAAYRRDPGEAIGDALVDGDTRLSARGLRAAGELGRTDLLADVRKALGDDDPARRFWAAWSATLLDDPAGVRALLALADAPGTYLEPAAMLAIRKRDVRDARRWIEVAGASTGFARATVLAAGALGDPTLVPWLLDRTTDESVGRLAGDAIATITGVVIEGPLVGEPGKDAGPTDDPLDESVAADPDDALPWPDPVALAAWWKTAEARFSRGGRWVGGAPCSIDVVERAIGTAPQHRRASAAIELALLRPGRPLAEVRGRGGRAHLPR